MSFTVKPRAAGRKSATQLVAYRKLAAAEAPPTTPEDALCVK